MTINDYQGWMGRDLYDSNDEKIGTVTDVYVDNVSERPEWLAVKTGWFGNNVSFVPIAGAVARDTTSGDSQDLRVNFDKAHVKDSPNVDDTGGSLSPHDEQMLYKHYGFSWDDRDPKHFGYGKDYGKAKRFDRGYDVVDQDYDQVETRDVETVTETIPIEANVRLRRYVTQGTKTVTVPTTEEHIEVEGVDARANQVGQTDQRL
jgi:sporulation protein YlmC with PRC-barrel domain